MTAVLPTLEYAAPMMLIGGEARIAFRRMLILSILSGLCVGSCFLSFADNWLVAGVQIIVFGATIWVAIGAGKALAVAIPIGDDATRYRRMVFDLIAALGLVIIGLAPAIYQLVERLQPTREEPMLAAGLGAAYAMLAISTPRHVMLYRALGQLCRSVNRDRMARGMVALGWVKTIYEMLWLGCCTLALFLAGSRGFLPSDFSNGAVFFAFAGLLGVGGFASVWIWMIVAHLRNF